MRSRWGRWGAAAGHSTGGGGGGSAPVNTVAPVISTDGTPVTGESVTVSTGTWTGSPTPTYTYQWKRAGANISGATASSYTLQVADVSTNVTCTVTGTNASGSANATSAAIVPAASGGGAPNNARTFDGSDDVIIFPAPPQFTEFTYVIVCKRNATGAFSALLGIGPASAGAPHMVIEFRTDNSIEYYSSNGGYHGTEESTLYNWQTTSWRLIAVTLGPTASGNLRFHAFDGTTWFHRVNTSGGGTGNVPGTWAGGDELRIANWNSSFNYFNGNIAVAALLRGSALSDVAVEALAGGNKTTWQAAGFQHLWEFNQASIATPVPDIPGTLDQSAIVGTTAVVGASVPTSLYNFT